MWRSGFRDLRREGGASVLSLDTTQNLERCEKNSPLYHALNDWLGQSVPWAHRGHLTAFGWWWPIGDFMAMSLLVALLGGDLTAREIAIVPLGQRRGANAH